MYEDSYRPVPVRLGPHEQEFAPGVGWNALLHDGDCDVRLRHTSMIVLGVLFSAAACGQATDEYRVKAVFLYNFAKFVDWPPQAFKGPTDPIVIGVLGKNPFGDALVGTAAGKTMGGRGFQVREVTDAQQAAGCQILFITASERKRVPSLINQIGNAGILIVGETDSFTADGGVINFKIEGGSVRLQINVEAARRQQLHISAKLLSLAEIVGK
jgi:hypothetical protein